MLRIQKYIANNSTISRRKAEELILNKKVNLNGRILTDLGVLVDPSKDTIRINNKVFYPTQNKIYILLNKPKGYICTVKDTHNRKTVLELLPDHLKDVYPVGRLDINSSGLLLLTNDGDFANIYTHPSFRHEKEYIVTIKGRITTKTIDILQKGIMLDGYITKPCKIRKLLDTGIYTYLSIILYEGRKRQIREMIKFTKHILINLKRIRIDQYKLNNLKEGEYTVIRKGDVLKTSPR